MRHGPVCRSMTQHGRDEALPRNALNCRWSGDDADGRTSGRTAGRRATAVRHPSRPVESLNAFQHRLHNPISRKNAPRLRGVVVAVYRPALVGQLCVRVGQLAISTPQISAGCLMQLLRFHRPIVPSSGAGARPVLPPCARPDCSCLRFTASFSRVSPAALPGVDAGRCKRRTGRGSGRCGGAAGP